MSSTIASAAAKTTEAAAASVSSTPGILPSIFNNVHAVGFAWMLSSAVLTTYSTTKFLKYPTTETDGYNRVQRNRRKTLESRFPLLASLTSSLSSPITAMSRAGLLTLYRFSGSLLLGLIAHPDFRVLGRMKQTFQLAPSFFVPAIFLFTANYSNSISLNRIGISVSSDMVHR